MTSRSSCWSSGSATCHGQRGRFQHPGRPDQSREPVLFYQRFSSDFQDLTGAAISWWATGWPTTYNGDNVPDYYPTLYPDGGLCPKDVHGNAIQPSTSPWVRLASALTAMAFPFVLPEGLPLPQVLSPATTTWVPNARLTAGPIRPIRRFMIQPPVNVAFDYESPEGTYSSLTTILLDTGDNLPVPPERAAVQPSNLVGLPDLARDALVAMDRSDLSGSTVFRCR